MPRRKVVRLNLEVVNPLIKSVCRNYTAFCEKMGRGASNWVADWNRKDENGNPKPKNLPSPAEAAKMCILLQTTPEDILLEPEDIALVNDLLEQEKGAKKALGQKAEGYTEQQKDAIDFVLSLTPEELRQFINGGRAMYGDNRDD